MVSTRPFDQSNCCATAQMNPQTRHRAACHRQILHSTGRPPRRPPIRVFHSPTDRSAHVMAPLSCLPCSVTLGRTPPQTSPSSRPSPLFCLLPAPACNPFMQAWRGSGRLDLLPACRYSLTTRGSTEPACCRPSGTPGWSTEVPQTDRQRASGAQLFASWFALSSWPTTRDRCATIADDPPDRTTTRGFIMPAETMAPTAPRF